MNQSGQHRPQAGPGQYAAAQDELHMSGISPHSQVSPRDYAPQIKLDQAPGMPSPQHQGAPSAVPNALTPGVSAGGRPPVMSATSTPSMHGGMTHSYSRSSPAANFDPSQAPYSAYSPTTPGGSTSQYGSPSDMLKYGTPGSQRHVSNTPLGLADIRPRADSSMSDSPGGLSSEFANAQPGPSNYLAPWAIYAFDWCKWRPQGNSAGKVALGSYLEDGHNFVR